MSAGAVIFDLSPKDRLSLQVFLDALESRFKPEAEPNLDKVSSENAVQTTRESIQPFRGQLGMLYGRMNSHSPEGNLSCTSLLWVFGIQRCRSK